MEYEMIETDFDNPTSGEVLPDDKLDAETKAMLAAIFCGGLPGGGFPSGELSDEEE